MSRYLRKTCLYLHTALELLHEGLVQDGDIIYISSTDEYYVCKNQVLMKICNHRAYETLFNAQKVILHPLEPVEYEYKIVEVSEEEWKKGLI